LANADAERFSVPFFFNPAYSTEYAPLPSTVDAQSPPRYRPINWGEFRARRRRLRRLWRKEPLPDFDSEAIDFRAASESSHIYLLKLGTNTGR
jgi:isopenicillin N synthase-like dioxygenase